MVKKRSAFWKQSLNAAGTNSNLFEYLIGGGSIDKYGTALTDETLAGCQASHAVLLGAVGGPKWDDPAARVRPEQGLLGLRKGLGVFANLRPVQVHPGLVNASPLKPEKLAGVDLLVVRELTGGLYFGQPKGRKMVDGHEHAVDTLEYADFEVRRVVELAFRLAQDAARKSPRWIRPMCWNRLACGARLPAHQAACYPDVALEHMLVDTASMRLVTNPAAFDVIVTENMFGDILTDEASVLAGSMGLLPSASLGDGRPGLYRADPRLGARYRRERHCQPDRHHPERGSAAALFVTPGERSGCHRNCRRSGDHPRLPDR